MTGIHLKPIGYVKNSIKGGKEDFWRHVQSEIILDSSIYGEESLQGLQGFSHIDIIYYFHKNLEDKKPIQHKRRPRGIKSFPELGILAQRAKRRENSLGLTRCLLLEVRESYLLVEGLDAFDGTPIVDIKPAFKAPEHLNTIVEPDWVTQLMKDYWKS